MQKSVRQSLVVGAGIAALAAVSWLAMRPSEPRIDSQDGRFGSPPGGIVQTVSHPPPAARQDAPPPRAAPEVEQQPPAAEPAAPDERVSELDGEAMRGSWENVDLEAVRQALPDNLYWKAAAPTEDPRLLEEREVERERWNVEYGKVLSGTGSDEEIRAYFDYRARLSGDYVEFATYLLDHYGEELPDRDVQLLKLARRLHLARLEELPRKVQEALLRKNQQDEARAAWLADEAAFDAADGAADDPQ
jgi:hypothetical protein